MKARDLLTRGGPMLGLVLVSAFFGVLVGPQFFSPGNLELIARQTAIVGDQFAGRVGLFLRVDDFDAAYRRMISAGVQFVSAPRIEPYGRVAVFLDIEGNRWDLLG